MILIVASTKDVASMNIAQQIIEQHGFEHLPENSQANNLSSSQVASGDVKLFFINEELIHSQYITEHLVPELVVFVSRHASVSGFPTLSVHVPGNLSEAELGGLNKRVSICPASAMKDAILELARKKAESNGQKQNHNRIERTQRFGSEGLTVFSAVFGFLLRRYNMNVCPRTSTRVDSVSLATLVATSL